MWVDTGEWLISKDTEMLVNIQESNWYPRILKRGYRETEVNCKDTVSNGIKKIYILYIPYREMIRNK